MSGTCREKLRRGEEQRRVVYSKFSEETKGICLTTREAEAEHRFVVPGVGVDAELEPLAVDVIRERLDPVRERLGVGHQIALHEIRRR
jgi:hypothetical protein